MNPGTDDQSLLLHNALVVQPDQQPRSASVLLEHGRIARLNTAAEPAMDHGGATQDLGNLTLFPGFIDIHIHGAAGVDTMAATAKDLLRVSRFLATHGVTAWLPTLVPAATENYARAINAIEEVMAEQAIPDRAAGGARVLGVHYEGPFVNVGQCGALHAEHFKTYSGANDVAALPIPKVAGAVRMITVAPEIDGGIELVSELHKRGWIVALGHTRAGFDVLDRAFAAGARHLTHFMNAMPPLHHRSPGPVGWGLSRDELTCDIIADGIHLDPLMLRLLLKVKAAQRLLLISDAIAAAGLGDGDYQIWGETISVAGGRTSNARGSIAGSVITMHDAVRMMLSLGASQSQVAQMAATNPARLLGLDKDCGTIEEGKRADLVALDQGGNVKATFVEGRLVFGS